MTTNRIACLFEKASKLQCPCCPPRTQHRPAYQLEVLDTGLGHTAAKVEAKGLELLVPFWLSVVEHQQVTLTRLHAAHNGNFVGGRRQPFREAPPIPECLSMQLRGYATPSKLPDPGITWNLSRFKMVSVGP